MGERGDGRYSGAAAGEVEGAEHSLLSKNLLGLSLRSPTHFLLSCLLFISRDICCVLLCAKNLVMNLCIYDHTTAEQIQNVHIYQMFLFIILCITS